MSGIPTSNGLDLNYMFEKLQNAPSTPGRLPNTDTVAALPREVRRAADDLARYFYEQAQRGLGMRRGHAINWMKVLSILSGIHYFKIDAYGQWRALRKHDDRQIRAQVPVLKHRYRREHGRLSSNQVGITASPLTGRSAEAFYNAQLAQDAMTHWIEEADMAGLEDEANQQLLCYGGYAYFAEKNAGRQQVIPRAFPFTDLMPIPYDARTWAEMDGVMRVTMVTEAWLQMQDEIYEMTHGGKKPDVRFAGMAGGQTVAPTADYIGFSSGIEWYSRFRGARVYWIWMKPTERNGWMGEHGFMIENKLMAYVSGKDETGRSLVCPNGELPLYPTYYVKTPHDWWPGGFCEELVPMQREMNRQFTNMLEAAQLNRGVLAYDQQYITQANIQDSLTGLVPFDTPGPETRHDIIKYIPPAPVGREMGQLLEMVDKFADSAASHESPLLQGESTGRIEGGPAIGTLNTNAQSPIVPVLDRKWRSLKKLYADALDGIREVWPIQKRIKVIGADNLGREILVQRNRIPGSDLVMLSPTPLVVNGRMGMLSLIQGLKQLPVEDGSGPILSNVEVRRSLQMLNLTPPGVDVYDKREQRIKYRVAQLIGDGVRPMAAPAGSGNPNEPQQFEDHALAIKIIKDVILDPSFGLYSPQVQGVLMKEFEYHQQMMGGIHQSVDNFDDHAERQDAIQTENMLDAVSNDPTSLSGTFAPMSYSF